MSEENFYDRYGEVLEAVTMALLTVLAVAGVYFSPLELKNFVNLDFMAFWSWRTFLIFLTVLPVIYSSYLSLEGFNRRVLASIIGFSGFWLGFLPGVVGLSVFSAVLLVSYSSNRSFTGENHLKVFFSSGGILATFLAVFLAVSVAYSVSFDGSSRQQLRESFVERVSDRAVRVANRTVSGVSRARKDRMVALAEELGVSASVMSISRTSEIVRRDINSSGVFNRTHLRVLSESLETASMTVPTEVSENVSATVETRFSGQEASEGIGETVRTAVSNAVEPVFSSTDILFGTMFVMLFSVFLLLRLPFKLFAMASGKLMLLFTRAQ